MQLRYSLTVGLFGAASFLSAGCIKTPTNDPVEYCIERAKLECSFQFECCTELDDRAENRNGFFFASGRNEGECNENAANLCRGAYDPLAISLERGRITMDEDAAKSCIDESRKALEQCTTVNETIACATPTQGTVKNGGACTDDRECSDGSCAFEFTASGDPKKYDKELAVAEGECTAFGKSGDACNFEGKQCSSDLTCNEDSVCAPYAKAGEACGAVECGSELVCDYSLDEAVCVKAPEKGEACDGECQDGLECVYSSGESGVCEEPAAICTGK